MYSDKKNTLARTNIRESGIIFSFVILLFNITVFIAIS